VGNREWCELSPQNGQGLQRTVARQTETGNRAPRWRLDLLVENIGKTPEQLEVASLGAVDRHVLMGAEPEDPEIVGTMHVVGVEVGEPYGIDEVHPLSNQLQAQLRRHVHQ
jgi:hypothetical protein